MSSCRACDRSLPDGSAYCPACGVAAGGPAAPAPLPPAVTPTPAPGTPAPGGFAAGTLLIGRYRVISLIGRGGMGEIFLADDLELGQQVALKFLPETVAARTGGLERFRTEARIARQVTHPNVARVHDVGQVDGRYFLSMEYVDGEDLEQLLRRIGRLPHEKAVEIARQMCLGLAAAHDKGVLHRDLKPANVMLDGRGQVRLTDFGLSAFVETGLGEGQIVGTPAYMSPEQITGKEVSPLSDLYSLGLVLYELFTGSPAFQSRTFGELRDNHQHDTPSMPSSIIAEMDPATERVIMQCLEKDPAMRPGSARSVALGLPGGDPLAAALAAGEIPAPEVVAAAGPIEGLHPAVAASAFVSFLLMVCLATFLAEKVNLIEKVDMAKPPEVLLDRARELTRELGWPAEPKDEAAWFGYDSGALRYLGDEEAGFVPEDWDDLGDGPAPVKFYYRSSPEPMRDLGNGVSLRTPAPVVPGMVTVVLDPQGRLRSFTAVPEDGVSAEETPPSLGWDEVMAAAGLEPDELQESLAPKRAPPVFADQRLAWDGRYPGMPEIPMTVEAASYLGRPVWFRAGEPRPLGPPDRRGGVPWLIFTSAILLGGIVLAWRNLRLGRGNMKGAIQVASFVFLTRALVWFLLGHFPNGAAEAFDALVTQIAYALFVAVFTWVYYLALEPYVRRAWPEALIPWSRLLTGRLSDPLIGRDLLVGGLWGTGIVTLGCLRRMAPGWLHWTPERPDLVFTEPLWGVSGTLGRTSNLAGDSVLMAMILVFLLVAFRVILRRTWLAEIAWLLTTATALLAILTASGAELIGSNVAYSLLVAGSLLFLILRFGLLASAAGLFFALLFAALPLTTDFGQWYFPVTLIVAGVSVALGGWGLRNALAGRPLIPVR